MRGRALAVLTAIVLPAPVLAQYVAPAPPPPVEQELPPLAAPETVPQAPPLSEWLPRPVAELEVLDKVEAVSHRLAVPVGQSAQLGSLNIKVQACDVRPPDQQEDATAYLSITDNRPDEAGFQGWMLADEPWLAVLQSPLYDVRVTGCRT